LALFLTQEDLCYPGTYGPLLLAIDGLTPAHRLGLYREGGFPHADLWGQAFPGQFSSRVRNWVGRKGGRADVRCAAV